MSSLRHIMQVCAFTFFAAWFLCLITGRSFRLPRLPELPVPGLVLQPSPPDPPDVKPSPIDMLKRTTR